MSNPDSIRTPILIDDAGQTINAGGCQNPRNRGVAERASSVLDLRSRVVIGYVWNAMAGKRFGRALDVVAGGWSLGGVVTLATWQAAGGCETATAAFTPSTARTERQP